MAQGSSHHDPRAYLADCGRWYIRQALDRRAGRGGETAELLGISRKSLWERMNRLGLGRPEAGEARG